MSNLPPPSTRLPGAPPPPILFPPHPHGAPRDLNTYSHFSPPLDENALAKLENEPGSQPPQEKYGNEPLSPVWQINEIPSPGPHQTQDGHHEQAPLKSPERATFVPAGGSLEKVSREELYKQASHEDLRPKVSPETIPASWDRPRDAAAPPARKPLALPASLPPKPVAALGDLNMQQPSPSLRSGHQSRGRRNQQQPSDEGHSHGTRWGGRDKDRERNRWGPAPEYQGPSLLARISSNEPTGRETIEREVGDVQRKKARTRKYQGV